jgi:methionyl-tRNA synthetase
MSKPLLTYDELGEFGTKFDIRMGQIVAAERVPKSFGLKLTVIFGPDKEDERCAFTNLGKDHEPESLLNVKAAFLMNLEPREFKGVMSQVMILAMPNLSNNEFEIGTKIL